VLDPDTPFETRLNPGFLTRRCMDGDGNVSVTCDWLPPVPLTEAELAFAQTVLLAYQQLDLEGGPLEVDGELITLINTGNCPAGTTVRYTVRPGDTLYGIGLQYNTTVNALVFGNDLPNTTILAGQELTVICGAQGPATLPSLGAPPVVVDIPLPPPTVPAFDCSGFAATSPLGGLSYGDNTFYWNAPASSPDQYRVTVSGEAGSATFMTGGGSLNVTGSLTTETVGGGFSFSWTVEALLNGEVMCTSASGVMFREAPPAQRRDSEPASTEEPRNEEPPGTEEPPSEGCGEFCEAA
jgi:hypothetical protein